MKLDAKGLPTEETVAEALQALALSDERFAQAKAKLKADELRMKITRQQAFLDSEGSVAERQAKAEASNEYRQAVDGYQNAVAEVELLNAKRERAHLVIDVFRTLEASKRRA